MTNILPIADTRAPDEAGAFRPPGHLHAVLESLPDTLFQLDREGRLLEFRQGRKPFPVRPADRILGRHFSHLLPADAVLQLQSALDQARSGEDGPSFELRAEVGSEERWYELTVYSVSVGGEASTPAFVVWARDISHRVVQRRALEEHRTQLRTLITAMADGMMLHSGVGRVINCNSSAAEILGLAESELLGRTMADLAATFLQADGQPLCPDHHPVQRSLGSGEAFRGEVLGVRVRKGALRWISMNTQPLYREGQASPYAVVTTFSDVTASRNAEQALRRSEERLALALDGGAMGMWDWDMAGDAFTLNRRCMEILGRTPGSEERNLQAIAELVHEADRGRVGQRLRNHLRGRIPGFDAEFRMQHNSGDFVWVKARGRVIDRDSDGRALRACGTLMDISEWKQLENRLRTLATTDPLTGLLDRRHAGKRLASQIKSSDENVAPGLILFDLDHFKQINDDHGHEVGDQVLCAVAREVGCQLEDGELFARWGGEEFALILPGSGGPVVAERAESVRCLIQDRIRLRGRPVTASFGAVEHRAGESSKALLKRADDLLYEAKRDGRNRVCSD